MQGGREASIRKNTANTSLSVSDQTLTKLSGSYSNNYNCTLR